MRLVSRCFAVASTLIVSLALTWPPQALAQSSQGKGTSQDKGVTVGTPGLIGAVFKAVEKSGTAPAGLKTTAIVPNGRAQAAGLRVGDIVTSVDGSPTRSVQTLRSALRGGGAVSLTVWRGDRIETVRIAPQQRFIFQKGPPVATGPTRPGAPVPGSESGETDAQRRAAAEAKARAEADAEQRRLADANAAAREKAAREAAARDEARRKAEAAVKSQPAPSHPSPPLPSAPPPTAKLPADTAWSTVNVFFGTDRKRVDEPKRIRFLPERGRELQTGRAVITVPKRHEVPQIERPWGWRIPLTSIVVGATEDPNLHFTISDIRLMARSEFAQLSRAQALAAARYKRTALVFVHGYNTTFDHALYRTAQIAYDIGFDGVPFLYSWPSAESTGAYVGDRENAAQAADYLAAFLRIVANDSGAERISLVAHSMGNLPLLEALVRARSSFPRNVVIDQIVMAAPDIDVDVFRGLARQLERAARRTTLYASGSDRALTASERLAAGFGSRLIPRAGDVPPSGPLVVKGIDTVDVTDVSLSMLGLNHSTYAESGLVLDDIGKLLRDGAAPDRRSGKLRRVETTAGPFWRFTP